MKKILLSLFVALLLTACSNDDIPTTETVSCTTEYVGIIDSQEFKNPTFGWPYSAEGNVWKWNKVGDTLNIWHTMPNIDSAVLLEYSFLAKKGACIKPIHLKSTGFQIGVPPAYEIYTSAYDLDIIVQEYDEDSILKVNLKTTVMTDRKAWVDFTPQNNVATPIWQ